MIRNLMDQLTGSILDEEGFIIDYAGDGIAAMWNAPADQPDHAELACWAAIHMQKVMDKLSEFWNFIAGETLSAGIGINTGIAHVGNSGSRWRLKYSPIGSTVNLASRLEGANKHFGTSILISEETRQQMFTSFPLRRVGPVMTKGSLEPIQVFQLLTEEQNENVSSDVLATYETALKSYEQRDFKATISLLEGLLSTRSDTISERLLAQARKDIESPNQNLAIRLQQK